MAMNGHAGPPGDGGAHDDFRHGPDQETWNRETTNREMTNPETTHPETTHPETTHPECDDLLPCGRSLYEVWEDHESGADTATGDGTDAVTSNGERAGARSSAAPGHRAADCPYCTDALQELLALDDFVQQARVEDEAAPPPDAAAVATRVMDLVRLELRPGRTLPLGEPDEDHWIVEAAAARTLRSAAESVPGVRAGSCRVAPADGATAERRAPVRVAVEVEAGTGRALPALAEAVRTAVARAADRAIGMRVAVVDVAVVDLFEEAEEGAGDEDEDEDRGDSEQRQGQGQGQEDEHQTAAEEDRW